MVETGKIEEGSQRDGRKKGSIRKEGALEMEEKKTGSGRVWKNELMEEIWKRRMEAVILQRCTFDNDGRTVLEF